MVINENAESYYKPNEAELLLKKNKKKLRIKTAQVNENKYNDLQEKKKRKEINNSKKKVAEWKKNTLQQSKKDGNDEEISKKQLINGK